MNIDRRQLLKVGTTAGLTAACNGVISQQLLAAEKLIPIVDTHQHLWDLSKFSPPWLAGAPEVIASSHVTADYLKATDGLNVVKSVYMEIDVAPEQQVEEAKHVIALSKSSDHPTVAAVISGRPHSAGFGKYITPLANSPYIKGVRQVLQVDGTPQGYCLQEQFVKSIQLLGELNLSFDLCMRPMELADGAALAKRCPDTRFIVDHCGNGDPKAWMKSAKSEPWHDVTTWKRGIELLAKNENTVCKISGIIARAPKGWKSDDLAVIVNFCLDSFGPDRVMFGSDWPVCKIGASLRDWVNALKQIVADRPTIEQHKLFHQNAIDFYKLS